MTCKLYAGAIIYFGTCPWAKGSVSNDVCRTKPAQVFYKAEFQICDFLLESRCWQDLGKVPDFDST